MLVLSRKTGQAVILGEDVEITVLRIEGDEVRLGIKAPRSVTVLRKELLEEVRSETAASIAPAGGPGAELRQISQRLRKMDR